VQEYCEICNDALWVAYTKSMKLQGKYSTHIALVEKFEMQS